MANLVSPGVSVSVIDESFYTPAEPGTTPMVFVATAQDKANASGTGTARGPKQKCSFIFHCVILCRYSLDVKFLFVCACNLRHSICNQIQ